MGAVPAATSGGTARTPGPAPNAGSQPAARHGPPRLPRGLVLSQPLYPGNEAQPRPRNSHLAPSRLTSPGGW
jgi:hypothetical protein